MFSFWTKLATLSEVRLCRYAKCSRSIEGLQMVLGRQNLSSDARVPQLSDVHSQHIAVALFNEAVRLAQVRTLSTPCFFALQIRGRLVLALVEW